MADAGSQISDDRPGGPGRIKVGLPPVDGQELERRHDRDPLVATAERAVADQRVQQSRRGHRGIAAGVALSKASGSEAAASKAAPSKVAGLSKVRPSGPA